MGKFGRRGSKRVAVGAELSKRTFRRAIAEAICPSVPNHLLALGGGVGDPHKPFGAFDVRNRDHFAFLGLRAAAILLKRIGRLKQRTP